VTGDGGEVCLAYGTWSGVVFERRGRLNKEGRAGVCGCRLTAGKRWGGKGGGRKERAVGKGGRKL